MHKNLYNLLLTISLISLGLPVHAGDPAAGKEKAQTCAACHGPNGNSAVPAWPRLAGQHAKYLEKQLQDFQSGRRENVQMSPMAAPLSAEDIADLASYFAQQKPQIGSANPELVEAGERLYRAGNPKSGVPACMACHGPDGAGNPAANYPALSGQHADYTAATLKAYKDESRSNDANSVMRSVAARLSNAEIEALAGYIQGLH